MSENGAITPERKAEIHELCEKLMVLMEGAKLTVASAACLTLAARYTGMLVVEAVLPANVGPFMETTIKTFIDTVEANIVMFGNQNGRLN